LRVAGLGLFSVCQAPEPEPDLFEEGGFVIGLFDPGARLGGLLFVARFLHVVSVGYSHLDLLALQY